MQLGVFIENIPQRDAEDRMDEYTRFCSKMKSYYIDELTVQMLAAKFVFDWNYAQIAEEFNIVNVETAYRMIKKAKMFLKERGFGNKK